MNPSATTTIDRRIFWAISCLAIWISPSLVFAPITGILKTLASVGLELVGLAGAGLLITGARSMARVATNKLAWNVIVLVGAGWLILVVLTLVRLLPKLLPQ
jgi:hypothetical protein